MKKKVDLLKKVDLTKLPVELLDLVDLPGCPVDLLESGQPAEVTHRLVFNRTDSTNCSTKVHHQNVTAHYVLAALMNNYRSPISR